MADQVEISNFGEGGVASEATLANLTKAIETLAKSTGKDPRSEAGKLQKLHNDATKSGIKVSTEHRDALKDNTEAVESNTNAFSNFNKKLLGVVASGLGALAGSAKEMTKELVMGGTRLSDFAEHLPLIGGHIGILTGFVDNTVDSFRDLSSVGVDFGGSITEVRVQAARAGVSLETFQRTISENSTTLALLGGNASRGAKIFTEVSKNVQKNFGDKFAGLGITMEETAEFTADYLEQQTRLGRAQGRDATSLAMGTDAYILQLDELSRITGKRRDQISAELKDVSADKRLKAILATAEPATKKAIEGTISVLENSSPEIAEGVRKLVASGGVPIDEFSQSLVREVEGIGGLAKGLRDGTVSQDQFLAAIRKSAAGLENMSQDEAKFLSTLEVLENPALAAKRELIGLANIGLKSKEAQEEQLTAQQRGNKGLLTFEKTITDLRNKIVGQLLESKTFEEVEKLFNSLMDVITDPKTIEAFAEGLKSALEYINGFVKDIQEKGLFATISERIGDALKSAISGLFSAAPITTGMVAAIGALFAANTVKNALGGALSGLFGSSSKTTSSSGPTKPSKTSGGKIGANIGGALGGLTGGILEGVGKALGALGKPPLSVYIPLGAAAIGAAIAAIGAGIAGAAWITGKALPTFTEGLKKFEELDGAKLQESALGLAAISGAMAAFGAGTAVAGLGALSGSITEGIAGLFGAESPMDKMKEFAKYDIDGTKVKNNAEALVAFSNAMAMAGLGDAASGLGTLVSGIAGGIGSLFGATSSVDQLVAFGQLDVNGEKVKTNAEAMSSFANAVSNMPIVPGANVFGAVKDSIVGLLGGETDPFASLVAFSNLSIGANTKINAEAMSLFANAVSDMPTVPGASVFGALKDGIAGFFGGETDPFSNLVTFSNLEINGAKVKTNAEAMAAFGNSMQSLPETMPSSGVFSGLTSLLTDTPFDQIQDFGNLEINSAKVKSNAEAMQAFGIALGNFPASINDIDIPSNLDDRLEDLAEVPDLTTIANGMQKIANVTNLKTTLDNFNQGLDNASVTKYADAISKLVDELDDLNKVLAEDNKNRRGKGTGVSAANIVSQGQSSSDASSLALSTLNTTMQEIKTVLEDSLAEHESIAKNTKDNRGNLIRS